jgi:hypothetical protein
MRPENPVGADLLQEHYNHRHPDSSAGMFDGEEIATEKPPSLTGYPILEVISLFQAAPGVVGAFSSSGPIQNNGRLGGVIRKGAHAPLL